MIESFRPVTTKNFQSKMKQAEDMAAKLLLPGAHSGGPGEDGEQLPPWVELFHRYFELKKNQLSKSASQEQVRLQIRTMQNTILPPPEPLGAEDTVTELPTELASRRNNNIPSINSSVAPGGTLTLIPVSTSTNNNNDRNVRQRVTSIPANNNANGTARSLGDLSSLVEMMNHNTRVMLRRPFSEVQRDYESSMQSLQVAKDENDQSRVMFYEMAVRNLFKELQSMDV
jgi:hypothetical protein